MSKHPLHMHKFGSKVMKKGLAVECVHQRLASLATQLMCCIHLYYIFTTADTDNNLSEDDGWEFVTLADQVTKKSRKEQKNYICLLNNL